MQYKKQDTLVWAIAPALFILLSSLAICLTSWPFMYLPEGGVPRAHVILIPGAAVLPEGVLSRMFQERVRTAAHLYQEGRAGKILVSGDNSTVSYNEVDPVREYLLREGIPDEDIYLDHAGFDTYSSLYRAKVVFKVRSIIVTTQAFHLPRAIFVGRTLRIPTYGVAADAGPVPIKYYLRELFAHQKAILNLIFGRVPKYLGTPIPIPAS